MNSTFAGLSIAKSGLYTATANLLVTSTNISNVDTDGYSQKTTQQSAVGPAAVYSGQYIGSGAEVTAISRVRNFRLDQKYWEENSSLGELQTKSDSLTEVETVLGSTDDNSFSTIMDDFYSALETLKTDPGDSSVRTEVVSEAESFCQSLNDLSSQLKELQDNINSEVKTTVQQINSYASQIASLNTQIRTATATGGDTSDLEDQRTTILDELSGLTDVTVTQTVVGTLPNGADDTVLSISVNGSTLVNDGTARQLKCTENTNGLYNVSWADTGDSFEPAGGSLKAYLDLRDGDGTNGDYQGIPYYVNQLNDFASTFASAFNTVHEAGYGLDGSTGLAFFTASDSSTTITADNISVSATIKEDTNKIAAASSYSSSSDNSENAENISDLIDLCEGDTMFGTCSAENAWTAIISTLGTQSEHTETMSDKRSSYVDSIDSRRSSVSGVSTNEETAKLTKYQEAYDASAQVISMWNEIYEKTIDMADD